MPCRLFRKAVQQGRSERRGESYSGPYVEPLSDVTCLREALRRRQGTPLEDFSSILLKQCFEFVNGQAGIANDSTHGDGIDGIMTRDCDDSLAVTHHKMLALADHPVAGFLKGTFGIKVIDSGKLWHVTPRRRFRARLAL